VEGRIASAPILRRSPPATTSATLVDPGADQTEEHTSDNDSDREPNEAES
jgi:hypothetical protein